MTITNDRIFNDAVFNYTREFPFLYEEIVIPVRYGDDRRLVEEILLRCAEPATAPLRELSDEARHELEQEYFVTIEDLTPRVYYRLTDNWLELTLRFVVKDHGTRTIKDEISRRILDELEAAGIGIASATFEVVGVPPVQIASTEPRPARPRSHRKDAHPH